jgi:hypothetical protein
MKKIHVTRKNGIVSLNRLNVSAVPLTSIIIIINKKRMAIAPTYITININERKSTKKNINVHAEQQKVKIKNIIA